MDEGITTSLVPRNWVPGQPPTASTDGFPTGRPPWSCKPCITPEVPTSLSFLATWPQARDYAMGSPGTQIVHSQEKFCGLPWMGAAPTAVIKLHRGYVLTFTGGFIGRINPKCLIHFQN